MRGLGVSRKVGLGVAMLFVVCVGAASANTVTAFVPETNALVYNGDPDGSAPAYGYSWTANFNSYPDGLTWDDFVVPAGVTWNVQAIWGNFTDNYFTYPPNAPTAAYWEIWPGNPQDVQYPGELTAQPVASGFTGVGNGGVFSGTPNGASGWGPNTLVEVSGLDLTLTGGTYWLGIAPYSPTADAMDYQGDQYLALTTSGPNAIGNPTLDGDSLTDYGGSGGPSPYYAININGGNMSYGVAGTPVPEPISMIFFGTGIAGVFGFVTRRRMQRN